MREGSGAADALAAALVVIVGGAVYTAIELFMLGRLAAVIACVGFFSGAIASAIARRLL
jgi:CDP-diglyceride synthetase